MVGRALGEKRTDDVCPGLKRPANRTSRYVEKRPGPFAPPQSRRDIVAVYLRRTYALERERQSELAFVSDIYEAF